MTRPKFRNQDKGVFRRDFFAKCAPSLGCGALSAECTAGANILGYFLISLAVELDSTETPFAS